MKRPRLTMALGGGGARGVAHLGVIDVLVGSGFEIDRIVGVSSGCLAGAMYAFDPDITRVLGKTLDYLLSPSFQEHQRTLFGASPGKDEVMTGGIFSWYNRVQDYLRANRIFHRVVRSPSLLPGVVLQEVVDHLLPDADVSDAVIPLTIVTVDLLSGHRIAIEKGPVRDAVRASSSLPGIFPPVKFNDMLLCDVGVFDSLPTTVASSYSPECLIAVEVSTGVKPLPKCETALDVLIRMDEIGETIFRKHVRDAADVVIMPRVSGVEWFDFSTPQKMIDAGRAAARTAIPQILGTGTPPPPE